VLKKKTMALQVPAKDENKMVFARPLCADQNQERAVGFATLKGEDGKRRNVSDDVDINVGNY
jgi:hypothetical protein